MNCMNTWLLVFINLKFTNAKCQGRLKYHGYKLPLLWYKGEAGYNICMQFTTYNECVATHALLQTRPISCQHLVLVSTQSLAGEEVIPAIQIYVWYHLLLYKQGVFPSLHFLFSKWDISTYHFQSCRFGNVLLLL